MLVVDEAVLPMKRTSAFGVAGSLVASLALVSCSAGAVERDAICERGPALELAVARTGELRNEALALNADVLRNQLQEDVQILLVASDVAPEKLAMDLSTVTGRLQGLYAAYEFTGWDQSKAASDDEVVESLENLDSPNSRRHLERIGEFLVEECDTEPITDSPPPDSVVVEVGPSTSIATVLPDRETPDAPIASAHIALGRVLAESRGIPIDDAKAQCLGREVEGITGAEQATNPEQYERAYDDAFVTCGVG